MLTTIISCSNKPNDEQIKGIILEFEKGKDMSKIYLSSPCDTGNTFLIPKYYITDYSLSNDRIITQKINSQIEIMYNLAEKGVISIKVNPYCYECKEFEKGYIVKLTNLGEKILNGENPEFYILNLYYLDEINLLHTERIAKDSIDVYYQLNLTPVYNVLNKFCSKLQMNNNTSHKNDTICKRIVYKKEEWVLQ